MRDRTLAVSTASAARESEATRLNLSWLLQLRALEIGCQLAAVLVVRFGFGAPLPLGPIGVLLALEVLSNLAAHAWARRARSVTELALGLLLSLDVLFFSVLLGLTGGPYNPFSFLYLVQIALGALILSPWASIALAALCFGADATLFAWHVWLPLQGQELGPHELHHLRSHVQGMWIALAVAAVFIVSFVQRMRRGLSAASDLAQRNEKLASLATLSAGAAHELSTPLSTIAVVARELEKRFQTGPHSASAFESALADVRLVRQQVDRCRAILQSMAAHAGESAGEAPEEQSLRELLEAAIAGVQPTPRVVLNGSGDQAQRVRVPRAALTQAIAGVVRNAQQAVGPSASAGVTVGASPRRGSWVIEVADSGPGMAPGVVARAGEPFFTTKPPGEGMGLGLFLARATAEQLGGRLEIESQLGVGTRVRFVLPREGP